LVPVGGHHGDDDDVTFIASEPPIVFDPTLVAVIAAYLLFLLVFGRLAAGGTESILGFFIAPTDPPRPPHTQEPDLPPFTFRSR
jgi:hypothetical protein